MNLPSITMDRTKARAAFLAYRDAVRARHSAEDAAIMRGYRTLAAGQQVLALSDAIAAGGLNDQGLPALAVARADHRWCRLRGQSRGFVFDGSDRWNVPHNAGPAAGVFRFDHTVLGVDWPPRTPRMVRAMVPIIPPGLRPVHALSGYHIIWEVDRWAQAPAPPGDPALLKRLGGDLYAVVAVWDLTDLERAVLAGRRP